MKKKKVSKKKEKEKNHTKKMGEKNISKTSKIYILNIKAKEMNT